MHRIVSDYTGGNNNEDGGSSNISVFIRARPPVFLHYILLRIKLTCLFFRMALVSSIF